MRKYYQTKSNIHLVLTVQSYNQIATDYNHSKPHNKDLVTNNKHVLFIFINIEKLISITKENHDLLRKMIKIDNSHS